MQEYTAIPSIAIELNETGYKTRKGNIFRTSTIQTILDNKDVYLGGYTYGNIKMQNAAHEAILTPEDVE